mgnify:CR=1 FL=1
MTQYEEEYISLYDITLEVNGRLYTTKEGFDHSVICALLDMDDLVLVEEEE